MIFMVSTMIFICAFPTLGSAMTGYSANVKAFVKVTDDNLVAFDTFRRASFVIHDGRRVNQTDDFIVYNDRGMNGMNYVHSIHMVLYSRTVSRRPSSYQSPTYNI
jgi:hypothetical protein